MMENGCKNFAFVSRSGTDKPEAERVIELLKGNGASVQVYRADASNDAEMVKIVSELSKTRSIRGVVHAAMVLRVRAPDAKLRLKLTQFLGWHL